MSKDIVYLRNAVKEDVHHIFLKARRESERKRPEAHRNWRGVRESGKRIEIGEELERVGSASKLARS